ncbi:MAG: tetratricopeptide repeat protein [Desulfuromonadales bacterium]
MNNLTLHGLVVIEGRATYERIASAIRDMEPDETLRQIQNFLKIYPDFAQAHNDLAVVYYRSGNGMKALAHYEKAHKLEPSNITYRKNLADFYFVELDWTDDAIHTYLDILKDNPFDVETLNALGTISSQIGRPEQARQYFTRTLQLDAVNNQARQALQQLGGQLPAPQPPAQIPDQQQQFLTPAVRHSPAPAPQAPAFQPQPQAPPQAPEPLYRQALELAHSGKTTEVVHALEKIILSYPAYAVAHNDLGVLYQQGGDLSRARHHHEEASRLQPANQVFKKNLADLLYIACGETEEAMKLYVNILGSMPRDIETLKAVSRICLEIGQTDSARTFLETILKIEPWNSEARESLAALVSAERAVYAAPAASRTADEIYAEAQQLVQQDRLSEAHLLLEELVRNHSNSALYHNDLGVIRYRRGDVEGARSAYERSVELQPANRNYRKNLADLYFAELGMVDDAIRIYLELFQQQPRDIETLASLGHISVTVGRPNEAKSFFRRALEVEPWNAEVRGALQGLM